MLLPKLEVRGSVRPDDIDGVTNRSSTAVATLLASAIRDRVQIRGKLAEGQPEPYPTENTRLTAGRYPVTGASHNRGGAEAWDSSDEFHDAANTRLGTFDVSGGMWDGLSVVIGRKSAAIQFRGRSEGQDPNWRTYKDGRKRARGKKVSNALKAATILRTKGVGLLSLTDQEFEEVASGVALGMVGAVPSLGPAGIEWELDPGAASGLAGAIARATLKG